MKAKLTPLQELYWKREKLIDLLGDKRITGEFRELIIKQALEITNTMDEMEEPTYAAM